MTDKNDPVEPEPEDAESTEPETVHVVDGVAADADLPVDSGDTVPASTDEDDVAPEDPTETALSEADEAILDKTAADLVSEMRTDMLRAQAELVNFRQRVERDRQANREAVIAEVVRALLPALDDLSRAEKHGDLDGGPLEIVAQKLKGGFDRFGLKTIGEKGEKFDPHFHEALVQLPSKDVTEQTVADVIDVGYALGDRVIRAAKVAVSVPE